MKKSYFRKEELDVFNTVLKMREQRMKMVQKPEQYLYIFKCLRDEIRSSRQLATIIMRPDLMSHYCCRMTKFYSVDEFIF